MVDRMRVKEEILMFRIELSNPGISEEVCLLVEFEVGVGAGVGAGEVWTRAGADSCVKRFKIIKRQIKLLTASEDDVIE